MLPSSSSNATPTTMTPLAPIAVKPASAFHRPESSQPCGFGPMYSSVPVHGAEMFSTATFPCMWPSCEVVYQNLVGLLLHKDDHLRNCSWRMPEGSERTAFFQFPRPLRPVLIKTELPILQRAALPTEPQKMFPAPVAPLSPMTHPPTKKIPQQTAVPLHPAAKVPEPPPSQPATKAAPVAAVAPFATATPSPSSSVTAIRTSRALDISMVKIQAGRPMRPRRPPEEVERLYGCDHPGCSKGYGTLSHLNTHIRIHKHGRMKMPADFEGMRKLLRTQKKESKGLKAKGAGGRRTSKEYVVTSETGTVQWDATPPDHPGRSSASDEDDLDQDHDMDDESDMDEEAVIAVGTPPSVLPHLPASAPE